METRGEMSPSLNNLGREKAELALLVLASQKIKAECLEEGERWRLVIEEGERARALAVLALYDLENSLSEKDALPGLSPPGTVDLVFPMLLVLVLSVIHLVGFVTNTHQAMVVRFGASAFYILQGEVYRCFTALMLHADLGHLAGNIVGILVLGTPVAALAGPVRGMGLILGCGVLGNFVNACLYRTAHLSIGASTSVMGAAGLLASFQMMRLLRWKGIHPKLFFPLGAGAALVGMLSGGENTDISAHVFGFLAGMVLGLLVGPSLSAVGSSRD